MDNQQSTQNPQEELIFDIKITNGAAQKLKSLMEYFGYKTAKEVVGLALELLDAAKEGREIIVRNNDGTAKQLTITPNSNSENGKAG